VECGRPYERDVYKKVYDGVCAEPRLCIGRCKSVPSMYTRMDKNGCTIAVEIRPILCRPDSYESLST
jgi:hypothetical protein